MYTKTVSRTSSHWKQKTTFLRENKICVFSKNNNLNSFWKGIPFILRRIYLLFVSYDNTINIWAFSVLKMVLFIYKNWAIYSKLKATSTLYAYISKSLTSTQTKICIKSSPYSLTKTQVLLKPGLKSSVIPPLDSRVLYFDIYVRLRFGLVNTINLNTHLG